MSSTNLEVIFEGPAVRSGTIDARLLAESLIGYSEVFTRANAILNGEASQATVLVQSDFKPGSFVAGLEFVQNISAHAAQFITSHQFLDANALALLIGFVPTEVAKEVAKEFAKGTVIGLFKGLRGKKPDEVKKADNDAVEITSGRERTTVNGNVFNLYGDSAIRLGLDKLTSPLREAEIERISVKKDNVQQAIAEKSEAEYFEAEPPLQLETDEEQMEGERDAVLTVSKLSFTEGSTWSFIERGATVVAKIEDQVFWDKVHQHTITFGEGDRLRVKLKWETVRKRNRLTPKNTIVKVYEVFEHPKQMRLDGRKDDTAGALPAPRGRKFR